MRKILCLLLLCSSVLIAQENPDKAILRRIFLPSIDMGIDVPVSDILKPSLRIATAVEYRIRNNNDFFIRLNYDTYSPRYVLPASLSTTNTIEGTARISELSLAPGYRFGDKDFRLMIALNPGLKFYEFPVATAQGPVLQLSLSSGRVFSTSAFSTLEYYFDEKSALTFSLYYNRVWEAVDFWAEGQNSYGASLGFITALL